jgi:hypothetical protein
MVTNPLHDYFFLSHTSIQEGIETCRGIGVARECWTEDGVRAYDSRFWAFLGNTFGFVTLAIRLCASYLAYRLIAGRR